MTTRAPAPPDAPLAGAPGARRLVRDAVAAPARVSRVDVVGPAGTGKSVLLDVLARVLGEQGRTVHRDLPDTEPGPDDALLVDDAHALLPADLERLAAWAAGPVGVLVAAHRPWPRPDGTAALGAALTIRRAPLVLGPLDRTGVDARLARLLGERAAELPDGLTDALLTQTAGLPALVDRLIVGLAEQAGADRSRWRLDPARPPRGLLAQLGYVIHRLSPALRDLLRARALGAPLELDVLVPLVAADAAELDELVEQARAEGLLTAAGTPVPLVSAAVLDRTPPAARLELQRALAERELERGGSVLGAARRLVGTGASGARVAGVFTTAAHEALRTGAPGAAELFAAAVGAGAQALPLAAARAEAALRAGDLDLALTQADEVLSASAQLPEADVTRAGTVAAAVLAHRGMLARSAELYRFLGAGPGPLAVPALIGTGALGEARALLDGSGAGRPPTLLAGAEELTAQGVYDSVAGSPTAALSGLTRAAALLESSHRAALLPDTPAALAALVAVHVGEMDVAQSVLTRAMRVGLGGRAAAVRHRLLLGWIALLRGATGTARAALAGATARPGGGPLEPRDEFLAAALEVALARRAGDIGALQPAWGRAREAIVRHPVDLFVLQQLGELSIAATRLRESSWVAPHLAEAAALLDRLGNPAIWAAPLHWSGLQAAILVESREDAARHAAALEAAAGASRYAAAMAAAAPHWVGMLDAQVDADAVEAAARGLHAVGLAWEGGKLAGQAAIRTRDRKAMSALLGTARALQASAAQSANLPAASTAAQGRPAGLGTGGLVAPDGSAAARSGPVGDGQPAGPAVTPTPVGAAPVTGDGPLADGAWSEPGDADGAEGPLSGREREVAALVLEGLTYKQIGERLFISAKTVEHHVARMRQRLGSGSRGELFAHLRQIVGPPD